jgi:hypothetical protein
VRDTRADAARRKRQKRQARMDREFVAWAHTLPCICCGVYGVEWHHEPPKSNPAWSDRSGLPLCAEHHRGKNGRHMMGRKGFAIFWAMDLDHAVTLAYEKYTRLVEPAEGGDF